MNQVIDGAGTRSRIVIVGGGYAGYHARGTWNAGCRAGPRRS
jgi:hypothetical protein